MGVLDMCSHQVEGIVAAEAALGVEELGAAMCVLHLARGPIRHLLVAGVGHAAVAGHDAEVHTVVVVAEYAAECAAVVWPFWFSSAFGLNVVKGFADFIQGPC